MSEEKGNQPDLGAAAKVRANSMSDVRQAWEKPVLLPLDVAHSEGNFPDIADEFDFKTAS